MPGAGAGAGAFVGAGAGAAAAAGAHPAAQAVVVWQQGVTAHLPQALVQALQQGFGWQQGLG
ncbi:MAG: hypothetical protein KDA36_05440 [Planctomycetaceae bacterium]|nr:hypothetical protein [Planctomycetaceae bacterium]